MLQLSAKQWGLLLYRYICERKPLINYNPPLTHTFSDTSPHYPRAIMPIVKLHCPQFGLLTGIKPFEAKIIRRFRLESKDIMYICNVELHCGVALAHCVTHGDESVEQFINCTARFQEAHRFARCLNRDPPSLTVPLWSLMSAASVTLLQGYKKYAPKDDKQQDVLQIKAFSDDVVQKWSGQEPGTYRSNVYGDFCMTRPT
jgi:hypothetical protein